MENSNLKNKESDREFLKRLHKESDEKKEKNAHYNSSVNFTMIACLFILIALSFIKSKDIDPSLLALAYSGVGGQMWHLYRTEKKWYYLLTMVACLVLVISHLYSYMVT